MQYNWQLKDWPHFRYSTDEVERELFLLSEKIGLVTGLLKNMPDSDRQEITIDIILAEAIKTSAIEGEFPNRKDVLSSIKKNLGLHQSPVQIRDKSAEGLGELMVDVRKTFHEPLTKAKLFAWHKMLMRNSKTVSAGAWRKHREPMQVISGAIGKEEIHFEAPPSKDVPKEMERFIHWFNDTSVDGKNMIANPTVRAAIAHLYFESIHPFEDGNGRIGRAIAEKALSQSVGRPVILSLSRTIEAGKREYYASLKAAQRSNEITAWINYFVHTTLAAQTEAEATIEFTLKKVKYFDRYRDQLNERQLKILTRMADEGPAGFKGGLNAKKYVSLTKVSKPTATRDLQELLAIGAIEHFNDKGGRSTSYKLKLL